MAIDYCNVVCGEDNFLNCEEEVILCLIRRGFPQPGDLLDLRPNGAVRFQNLKTVSEKLIQTIRISLSIKPWPDIDLFPGKNSDIVLPIAGDCAGGSQARTSYQKDYRKYCIPHLNLQAK